MQRLAWKTEIIERLEEARQDKNKVFSTTELNALGSEEFPLAYGSVKGVLLSDKEILLGPKTQEGQIGYHLITPLKIRDNATLLVHRGWVPENYKDPIYRNHLRAQGSVRFTGILRKPDWNGFTSGNSPENDLWFKMDIEEIAQAKKLQNTLPVILYAESASRKFDSHKMNSPGWIPRNKHKQYAIFWFAMAGALILVFGLYWRQQRQLS